MRHAFRILTHSLAAALKCRQRKKAWLAQLQAKVEYMSNENERLTSALISAREEIARLSSLVGGVAVAGGMAHHGNGATNGAPSTNGATSTNGNAAASHGSNGGAASDNAKGGPAVSVNVNLPPAPKTAMAGGGNRGYGY